LLEPVRLRFLSRCRRGGFGDNPASKDLTGTAKTAADEKETKLDAASPLLAKGFGVHATLK
jgi:hypothetical protein